MSEYLVPETAEVRKKGFTEYCGLNFDQIADDGCVVSVLLRPELLNPAGIAHGGLVATLTDVAAGLMALQADSWKRNVVTQNCDIHYLRPNSGDKLTAESHVIRMGKRVCVVQVECFRDDGKISASAIYEIAYLDAEQKS